jgi:hypothetical protein
MTVGIFARHKAYKLRTLSLGIAALLFLSLIISLSLPAYAASAVSGLKGSTLVVKSGGFQPGEQVSLWTTDPNGKAVGASYILADSNGNIEAHIQTTDPEGLTTTNASNYTQFETVYDNDGNLIGQYLLVVLYQPSVGNWHLTGLGNNSNVSKVMDFSIVTGSTFINITAKAAFTATGQAFTMSAGGFDPGERVNLWTTDPNGKATDASYILADASGNISLRVESADPQGLTDANATTFTRLQTVYDSDGNVVSQYLQVVLRSPASGNWQLTAQGATSNTGAVFSYTIS